MTRQITSLLLFGRAQGAIAMKKSKTHFEQVPLELVKKIAKEDLPHNAFKKKTVRSPQLQRSKSQPRRTPSPAKKLKAGV
jgi:hypothetical protein